METNGNKVEKTVNVAKEKISQNLSGVAEKVHRGSDTAKDVLSDKTEKVEDYIREKTYVAGDLTNQTVERASKLGHKAADALSKSSEYIENFDYRDTKKAVSETIKDKPQIMLVAAGIFGFLLGILVGRRK